MTDRKHLDQHTDDTLTELYDQRDQAQRIAVALENENATTETELDRLRAQLSDAITGVNAATLQRAEAEEETTRLRSQLAVADSSLERTRTRLGSALACVRLLRIYADCLDHGRQVDATGVAHRIRRIVAGLDDQPTNDPEPQRQLAAAIEALGASETENAELRARITTLEHVAAGNKRHVQLIVPELENCDAARRALREQLAHAEAERDQHAATIARVTAECGRIAQLPAVADDSGRADTFDTGARWTLRMIRTALTGSCPGCAVPGCGCDNAGAAQADAEGSPPCTP